MKTNNIIKALGTANVVLFIIAIVLTYCVMVPLSEMQVDVAKQDLKEIFVVCLACMSILFLVFSFCNGVLSLIINYDWHDQIKRDKAIAFADKIFDALSNPAIDFFEIELGKESISIHKADLIARAEHPERYDDKNDHQTYKIFSYEMLVRYSGDFEDKERQPNMFVVVRKDRNLYRRCARIEHKKW